MNIRFPSLLLGLLCSICLPQWLQAQSVTSSAAEGTVVAADTQVPLNNAFLELVHEPTGSTYSALSDDDGRFRFTGLRPGGPYSLNVNKHGFRSVSQEGLTFGLQQTATVNVALPPVPAIQEDDTGKIFELEAFQVLAEDQNLVFIDSNQGTSTRIDLQTINKVPTISRSLSDIARLDSRIAIYDRDSGQISAGGRNTRYNSLLIDGVPTNDSFGLSDSGLPALKQPFSLEAIAEVQIAHSPYSVENSGFTGAAITAITKSGSNRFSGSVFGYYRNDSMVGELTEVDSDDIIEFDDFEEYTVGASYSGPIIKDKLFFYILYEKVEETRVRDEPTVDPDDEDIERLIRAAANFQTPFDIGEYNNPDSVSLQDDKFLLKLDWNINNMHRMTARYNQTIGVDPNINNGFTSTWYDTEYTLRDVTLELFSNWSPDFSTEMRISLKEQGQNRVNASSIPYINVDGIGAESLDRPGERITTALDFGASAINDLDVDTDIIHFKAVYFLGAHELKFGLQYQSTANRHIELTRPYGYFRYEDILFYEEGLGVGNRGIPPEDGTAGNVQIQTTLPGQSPVAEFTLTQLAAFIEDVWTFNDRLTITLGLRIDYPTVDQPPAEARQSLDDSPRSFEQVFGTSNQNTIDGNYVIQPRFGFNYAIKEDRTMQFRGGLGLFYGTAPHVWLATTYVDNGISKIFLDTGLRQKNPPFTISSDELVDWFNQQGEIETDLGTVDVNYLDPDFKMPTEWKSNLAFDMEIPKIGAILTLEGQWGWIEQDVHYVHRNLKIKDRSYFTGFLPDGRRLYSGDEKERQDRYQELGYANVIELTNTKKGETTQYTIQLDRPLKNNIGWRLAYTYSRNRTVADAFTGGGRLAYNNWLANTSFDANSDVLATSNFETTHRIVGSVTYELRWSKKQKTSFTLVYDGRSGRPFSYIGEISSPDLNGDFGDDNDLLYVPSGPNDPIVSWGNRNNRLDQRDAFFAYVDATPGLRDYKGGVVPRNTGKAPWIHQFDLNITHEIMTWENQKLELIFNLQNIGNLINEEWGREKRPRNFGKVSVLRTTRHNGRGNMFFEGTENGYYVYNYEPVTDRTFYFHPSGISSRWAAQVGIRYSF